MNDEIMTRLKIIVERAVRPVRASTLRKRRMREELLAHLAATFEEEVQRLGDEQTAVARAEKRFGYPGELTAQLQESIPRRDWLARFREMQQFRPGGSLIRRAACLVLLAFMGYAATMGLIGIPLLVHRGRLGDLPIAGYVLFITLVFTLGLSFVFSLFLDRMYPALYGPRPERSLPRAMAYGLLSVPVFPISFLVLYWVLTDGVALLYPRLPVLCLAAILTPALLVAIAQQTAREMRLDEEWTNLKIEE